MDAIGDKLMAIYDRLFAHFGPQHWWPGDSPFEVMVGAVLTQNTAWTHVEKAIKNIKTAGCLSFEGLFSLPPQALAALIQPAGYFNVKTKRLRNLLKTIAETSDGDLDRFFDQSASHLRELLLGTNGVGPETADSIILYAAQKPVFVIDTYTKRLLVRHSLASEEADYSEMQDLFTNHLPDDLALFNEYHALIVAAGKHFCRPREPLCTTCPLGSLLPS